MSRKGSRGASAVRRWGPLSAVETPTSPGPRGLPTGCRRTGRACDLPPLVPPPSPLSFSLPPSAPPRLSRSQSSPLPSPPPAAILPPGPLPRLGRLPGRVCVRAAESRPEIFPPMPEIFPPMPTGPLTSLPQSRHSPNSITLAPAASAQPWRGLGPGKSGPSPPSRPGSNQTTTPFKMIMKIIIIITLFLDHCRFSVLFYFHSILAGTMGQGAVGEGVEITDLGCLKTTQPEADTPPRQSTPPPTPTPDIDPYTPTHTDRPTKTDPAQTNPHTQPNRQTGDRRARTSSEDAYRHCLIYRHTPTPLPLYARTGGLFGLHQAAGSRTGSGLQTRGLQVRRLRWGDSRQPWPDASPKSGVRVG